MWARLRKWLKLSGGQRRALVIAIVRLAGARLALARRPVAEILLGREPLAPRCADADDQIARIRWAIATAAGLVPWRSDCLVQAMAARRWLATSGIASEIRLGAAGTGDAALTAHAWVVAGGTVVVGGPAPQVDGYAEFAKGPLNPGTAARPEA